MPLGRDGEEIELAAAGEALSAYRAIPAAGRGRGVLVLHEGWGLVDQIRDVCDRLAREGFVALAPDLYRGRTAREPDEAGRLAQSLDPARVAADCDAAVRELLSCHATDGARVGALGFCMGGWIALYAAARNRRIGAAVDFYGAHPTLPLDLAGLGAAVLALFAERDAYLPPDAAERLRRDLAAAGARATVRTVPGVAHGFMNDARPDVFDARAASEGWDALLAFLRAELS